MQFGKLHVLLPVFMVFLAGCVGQPATQPPAEETVTTPPARQASLDVSSQSVENSQISIDSFYLDMPGYVVIHKDVDGKPGPVLGHSELVSGEKTNFKVAIDASQAGTRVFAMLHYDDDGDGEYGFPDEDNPVILAGNVIVKPVDIIVQEPETAPEITEPQPAVKEFTFETDDSGYYVDGEEITSISAAKGDVVKITFNLRTEGIYPAGAEYRGCETASPSAKPGGTTSMEFTASSACIITAYWPASGVAKASLQVMVG